MLMGSSGLLAVILVVAIVLYVKQIVRTEVTSLAIIATLAFTGILDPVEALSGFSSTATLTVGAMLVLSAGLQKAGVVDLLVARLARMGSGGELRMLIALCGPTMLLSAFMNNTPIVALMIPVTITLSQRFGGAPSRLLLPVSIASMLGGTCTLIGTSTNILIDSLYRESGGPGLRMFEFTAMGIIYVVVGGAYIVLMAPRLLPTRTSLTELLAASGPDSFLTEVTIPSGSLLVGQELRHAFKGAKVSVIELVRDEEPMLCPDPGMRLCAGDVLLLESSARGIHALVSAADVEPGTVVADDERVTIGPVNLHIAEAVVTPRSRFKYRLVKDLGLTRRHRIRVLAIRRMGRQHQYGLRNLRVRAGDVLLVEGEPHALRALQEDGDVLLIEGVSATLTSPQKAPLAAAILAAVVLAAALNVAPIVLLSIAGATVMLVTGCIDIPKATQALDPSVLLLLAGTIPLGLAMEKTGLAAAVASTVVSSVDGFGNVILISAIYLLTATLSGFLSNNATAVLLVPIVLDVAIQLGVAPMPLLMAVAFGASASFYTPIGYQTNAMVMGPGGYVFSDYLRFGLPLNLLLWATATILIPIFWPV